jgi:hypothetical protein
VEAEIGWLIIREARAFLVKETLAEQGEKRSAVAHPVRLSITEPVAAVLEKKAAMQLMKEPAAAA